MLTPSCPISQHIYFIVVQQSKGCLWLDLKTQNKSKQTYTSIHSRTTHAVDVTDLISFYRACIKNVFLYRSVRVVDMENKFSVLIIYKHR